MSTPPTAGVDQPFEVLVVDDDPAVLRTLVRLLRAKGHKVWAVPDAASALATIARGGIEVVISDVSMPGIGGIDLLRRIRAADLDLPVVLLTGSPDVRSASDAMELRAFRYVVKPPSTEELLETLRRAVFTYRLVKLRRKTADGEGAEQGRSSEATFRAAIEQLWMAYQPIVAADTGRVMGFEALLRTREPSVPHPGVLLDLASRLGTLVELGRAARDRVAADIGRGGGELVFVNIAAADLADPTLTNAEAPLSRMASRVVLELTERQGLEGVQDVPGRLDALRDLGFRIAIDDLGAGYSALSYFAMLEPDLIKLDMSLVRGIEQSAVKQRTVLALVQLGHSLGMEVVAEGIETRAERDTVVRLGCDFLQGYLFARPGPPFPRVEHRLHSTE